MEKKEKHDRNELENMSVEGLLYLAKGWRKSDPETMREAQYCLGERYEAGIGVEADIHEAMGWYAFAASKGHPGAGDKVYRRGLDYEYGRGVEKDLDEACEWYKLASRSGHPGAGESLYRWGRRYESGDGVEKDLDRAEVCYHCAARSGHPGAVEREKLFMAKWRQAAEQGDPREQAWLGRCYYFGRGVEQNEAEALKWYRAAAEQGNSEAQYMLGIIYHNASFPSYEEISKPKGWIRKAAEELGDVTFESEALKWMQKAAQKNSQAMRWLANYYSHGEERDAAVATHWYQQAAEQGDAESQLWLGKFYESDKETYENAAAWYRKAADQGYGSGMSALGHCYELGIGVEKDIFMASKWYAKAAKKMFWESLRSPYVPHWLL